jgi:hypothetical protein
MLAYYFAIRSTARASTGSHVLQDFVSVQVRHHDIQKHEVKGLRSQNAQCFATISCNCYILIALDIKLLGERITILFLIIDD